MQRVTMQSLGQRFSVCFKSRPCRGIFIVLLTFLGVISFSTNVHFSYALDSANVSTAPNSELIPRRVLFGNPDKIVVRLSPGGAYLSYVAPHDGVLNVFVVSLEGASGPAEIKKRLSHPKPVTFDTMQGIREYSWLYDGQHIIYSQDKDGDENHGLFLVDINNPKKPKRITPPGAKAMLVGTSYLKPDQLVYAVNDRNPSYFDLYRYTLSSGQSQRILKNDSFTNFVVDSNLDLAFLEKTHEDGSVDILQVKLSDKTENEISDEPALKKIKSLGYEDKQLFTILGLSLDNALLYTLDPTGVDAAVLKTYDVATGVETVIARPPMETDTGVSQGEISDVMVHPKTYAIQAYTYDFTKPRDVVLDSVIEADLKYLQGLHRGTVNVLSRTLNDDVWIVAYMPDDGPIAYYLYDRSHKKAVFLFYHNSQLADLPSGTSLAPMHPVVIKSRDGLPLVSYLTLPPTAPKLSKDPEHSPQLIVQDLPQPLQPLPMVLVVHGGPAIRDAWGYDPLHQFFANRGYAVLSVNYRGSRGFGKKFLKAGDGEWAGKMQDDLLDAVDWAVEAGIADKDKIAIFGGSYGGYATLVGLTQTPERFACGVDLVGPSNLETLYDSIPPYWKPFAAQLEQKMGGHTRNEEGKAVLRAKSPLHKVAAISKPLLVAQGANDPRVKQSESDQIVAKMKDGKIPVTYLLYPDEGHGFVRPENRLSFMGYTDAFLARCLGGSFEPMGRDKETSSVVLRQVQQNGVG